MKIFTYGITTSRYSSSLIWQNDKILTCVGPTLNLWNLETLKREQVFHYNSNVVMVLIENTNFIFSVSYNGEIAIIDKHSLQLVTKTRCEGKWIRHASTTDDYFVVSAEGGPNKCKGITSVFSLKGLDKNAKEHTFENVFKLEGRYRYCHMLEGGKLFVTQENIINEKERQEWRDQKEKDPNVTKETKPKKICTYDLFLFDMETKAQLVTKTLDHRSCVISSMSNNRDLVNLLYLDRHFIVLNPLTMEVIVDTMVAGSGAILASGLVGQSTFISPKSGILIEINLDTVKNFPSTLEIDKVPLDSAKIYKVPGSGIDSKIFCFLLQNPKTGVICFEDGINVVDFVTNKTKKITCFNITCCGVALSNKGDLVACGDFSGNVHLFPTEPTLNMEPLSTAFIMESIRTLIFDSKDESVIIGTLSGKLIRWWTNQDPNEPKPLALFEEGVLNVRYSYHDDGEKFLVVGLASGMFAVFKEVEYEHHMMFVLGHYAHIPSHELRSADFGSLHKYAEIWSTVWGATSNKHVVTACEDQTCCVWDISNKNASLAHKLTGHTKAVTSIDWRVMDPALGEIFISCSDDQTARVYDPRDGFKLLFTFSTSFINEWHTLTYLSLEKDGTRVALGSQNGFLFVYDLLHKEFLFAERMHNGSVEGLDWKGDTIVTCSADNSIIMIRMPKLAS